MTARADPIAYAPRGLRREEAARYVGVSAATFDRMVADSRMPRPKRVNGCVIWDRVAIDMAFTALPGDESADEQFFQRLFDKKKAG